MPCGRVPCLCDLPRLEKLKQAQAWESFDRLLLRRKACGERTWCSGQCFLPRCTADVRWWLKNEAGG